MPGKRTRSDFSASDDDDAPLLLLDFSTSTSDFSTSADDDDDLDDDFFDDFFAADDAPPARKRLRRKASSPPAAVTATITPVTTTTTTTTITSARMKVAARLFRDANANWAVILSANQHRTADGGGGLVWSYSARTTDIPTHEREDLLAGIRTDENEDLLAAVVVKSPSDVYDALATLLATTVLNRRGEILDPDAPDAAPLGKPAKKRLEALALQNHAAKAAARTAKTAALKRSSVARRVHHFLKDVAKKHARAHTTNKISIPRLYRALPELKTKIDQHDSTLETSLLSTAPRTRSAAAAAGSSSCTCK